MWNRRGLFLLFLLISAWAVVAATGYERQRRWEEEEEEEEEEQEERERERRRAEEEEEEEEEEYGGGGGGGRRGAFLLDKPRVVVKTEAGTMKVVKGYTWGTTTWPSNMHIGFIEMEPNTLFLPQYMDAHLILFIKKGKVRVGRIFKDELVERNLTMGDVYTIPAGSAFYMANDLEGKRLQIICSIDSSDHSFQSMAPFQSFFIGGGLYPTSVLSGFDTYTLTTALNVTKDELSVIMGKQTGGPIVFMDSHDIEGEGGSGGEAEKRKKMELMLRMKHNQIHQTGRRLQEEDSDDDEEEDMVELKPQDNVLNEEEDAKKWTWRKVLNLILRIEDFEGIGGGNKASGPAKAPDSYNLYDRNPDFRNEYGWSVAIDKHDFKPLKQFGIGIYLVNLTAGSMLAPHINPMAAEYGVVTRGSGTLHVVYPNGTSAMNVEVYEGDVFWIPRYFPFCQIAARSEPLEFFGFTTSAKRNRPQFLVGAASVLKTMRGPEMAVAFDTTEERLAELLAAQKESVILPPWRSTRYEEEEEEGGGEEEAAWEGKGYEKKGKKKKMMEEGA